MNENHSCDCALDIFITTIATTARVKTSAGNDDVSPQQTLLTENRDDLRTSGDFDGKRSFRRLTAGEPGGVAESESCLDYQMRMCKSDFNSCKICKSNFTYCKICM